MMYVIATRTKSLNIKYEFYVFRGDLIEAINQWIIISMQ